jgi:hypothetical protein
MDSNRYFSYQPVPGETSLGAGSTWPAGLITPCRYGLIGTPGPGALSLSRNQLEQGTSVAQGYAVYEPHQVGTATNWANMAVGDTPWLREPMALYGPWGYNQYGQTGDPRCERCNDACRWAQKQWSPHAAQHSSFARWLPMFGTLPVNLGGGHNETGELGIGTTFQSSQ